MIAGGRYGNNLLMAFVVVGMGIIVVLLTQHCLSMRKQSSQVEPENHIVVTPENIYSGLSVNEVKELLGSDYRLVNHEGGGIGMYYLEGSTNIMLELRYDYSNSEYRVYYDITFPNGCVF